MRIEVHDYRRQLQRRIELIEKSDICRRNKADMLAFHNQCFAEGLSTARTSKYLYHLHRLALMLGKPFRQTTKRDLFSLVEQIERKSWADWTKHDYKVALKKFFRWLKQTDDYPDEVRWIKAKVKNANHKLPEEVLTQEEIKRLAVTASNARDRAFIQVLYESGCRIGEFLSLRTKSVQFDRYGAVLLVNGKTGSRRVRIISSAPSLATWLENHPLRSNPEAPLWVILGTRNNHGLMSYGSTSKLLKDLAERAGVKKAVNPHSFRHARATHLASSLTEAQLKEMFGWVQSSDMASTYVHLSGRDVDNALLRLQGIVQEDEEKREQVLKVRGCQRCQESNDPVSKFCRRCGSPLDLKIALDLEEQKNAKDGVAAAVVQRVIEKLNLEQVVYETIKEMKSEKEFEN